MWFTTSLTSTSTCYDWVDRQMRIYENSMWNTENALTYIAQQMGEQGDNMLSNMWWQAPPSPAEWDMRGVVEQIFNGALKIIPYVGGTLAEVGQLLETHFDQNPPPTPTPATNPAAVWSNFMSQVGTQINAANTIIESQGSNAPKTVGVLTSVLQGGNYFVDNDLTFTPGMATVWNTQKSYYMAKLAMVGLKAQDIFIVSAPVSLLSSGSACTEDIADQFAQQFGGSGAAWCNEPNGAWVLIPVVGYANALYTQWGNMVSGAGSDSNTILQSSSQCYSGFGVTTMSITLYDNSHDMAVISGTTSPDMTQPCAWSVPICDYDTWSAHMSDAGYPSDSQDAQMTPQSPMENLSNVASYCAYQWGMVPTATFCGGATDTIEVDDGPPYQSPTAGCTGSSNWFPAWMPPKIVGVGTD